MDLDRVEIELVQFLDQNCQAQTAPINPIRMSVSATAPNRLIWEGVNRQGNPYKAGYVNVWSLDRVIGSLPAAREWTLRVTATTFGGVSRSRDIVYVSPTAGQC